MGNGFVGWFARSYKVIIVALVAIMALLLVVLAFQHVNESKPAVGAEAGPVPTFSSEATPDPLTPVTTAAGTRALIFGDSWTVGYVANPLDHGYAYLTADTMQWDATVDGVAGTGYTNPGPNNEGTFIDRIGKLPDTLNPQLVVLQGSVNDSGANFGDLRSAVTRTVAAAQAKYPAADIVLLGPAATEAPLSEGVQRVDNTLRIVASKQRLNYISPIEEQWFTADNIGQMIDAVNGKHPTTAGHELLAEKLESDLRNLSR